MRVMVTGGAGFIGSTLVDRLLDSGHEVVVVDNLSSGRLENLERASRDFGDQLTIHVHDIRDEGTEDLVEACRVSAICHLAAQMDVRVSVQDPVLDASINVIGFLRVLEGARRAGCRKFVFASSGGTIYGEVADVDLPASEDVAQIPESPYGVTKKVASDYLEVYRRLHGLEWLSLALANVYGPRQDPHGEAGVVAIFCGRMADGQPCTIYGDGLQTRDYVFVGDVAEAFELGLDMGGGLVNIGTGIETSVIDLHDCVAGAVDFDGAPSFAEARAGELQRSALDATRAASELGWRPLTGLEEGIGLTAAWFADAGRAG